MKSNSSKMTKALDKLDNWIDEAESVTESTIKSRLNTYLKNAGVLLNILYKLPMLLLGQSLGLYCDYNILYKI